MSSALLELIDNGWSINRVEESNAIRYEFVRRTPSPNNNDPTAEPTEKVEWFNVYLVQHLLNFENYCYVRFEPGRAIRDKELKLINSFITELKET